MKNSIDYYISSKRNFIEQFELLQILSEIENILSVKDIDSLNNEEINEVINLQAQFCNIYYKNNILEEELQEKYQSAVDKFNQEFEFDEDLEKYLDTKHSSSSIIKEELNDNFHQYLYFYSQLNLAPDIKSRLDFKNIKILMKVDENRRNRNLIEQFDNMLQSGLASNGFNSNADKTIREYRLELMKRAGIMSKDARYMSFDKAIKEIQKEQQNKTAEEKEREKKREAQKKREVNEYIKKLNSTGR